VHVGNFPGFRRNATVFLQRINGKVGSLRRGLKENARAKSCGRNVPGEGKL
jgi:hypothetical protein